ncbi:MAG: hypothetical protein QM775_35445 [Pirellulales bacterium]
MPDLFADMERNDKRHRVEVLTHFLMSTATADQQDGFFDGGAVKRGEQLFHEVGCAACHNSQQPARSRFRLPCRSERRPPSTRTIR